MTSPYSSPAPKKLERSRSNRFLGGVCGGLANYLNMDPTLVRVLTVLITLFTGIPIILYIVALFVVPEEGSQSNQPGYPPVQGPPNAGVGYPPAPSAGSYNPVPTYAPNPTAPPAAWPPAQSAPSASRGDDPVWGTAGAPWEQPTSSAPFTSSDPVAPADPAPVEPTDPEPVAPSEPEAPVVPPSDDPQPEAPSGPSDQSPPKTV